MFQTTFILALQDRFKFTILNAILVTKPGDLVELVDSEARVMLLYCTREEAIDILTRARDLKLTGENYVWVVTQSVIENLQTPSQFPVGMLGMLFQIYFTYTCAPSIITFQHISRTYKTTFYLYFLFFYVFIEY